MFLELFLNTKYFSENLTFLKKNFRHRYSSIVQSIEYFLVVIVLFNLVHSFLLSMSRNILEFITKFQIVSEKHAIFHVQKPEG